MAIKELSWDSSFFDLKVGELFLDKEIEKIVPSEQFDVIYTKQTLDFNFEINGYEESFKETKVIFTKEITETEFCDNTLVIDFDEFPLPKEELYQLAYISGNHSRFLLDTKFSNQKFRSLYEMWVDNSINKQFAKKIFYTKDGDTITGFVTYQEKNKIGNIGLIATLPSYQGKGLGKKLLKRVEEYCASQSITTLEIPTQKENIQACGFYKSCKYNVKEEIIIKHFWRK